MHKGRDVYGYEVWVLALANIGIQSGGAKRGGGAGLVGYYHYPYPKKIPPSCCGGGALGWCFGKRGKMRWFKFSQSTCMF